MLFGDMTATDARRELPLPARLLDALSGVFIVTLFCVLIFGPIRIDAVVATLSVSSLARLLVLLAASVAVRHLAWPRPPLHLRFLAAARALAGSVALRRVLPTFLATRGAVLFTGVLAVLTIGFPDGEPPVRISESEVVNLPLRWDAGWYLDIAVHGYRWSPAAEGQQNVAFFPAYPALMSLGAALVNAGNEPEGLGVRLSYERYYVWHLAAGLVVALAAFLWGLAYVYRLAREDLDDRSATSAVLLLCAFPFAVFYGAPYWESLFLLVTVAAFFHARRGGWGVACVWGALAGLTRPNGFVLCIPLALLALQARAARRSPGWRLRRRSADWPRSRCTCWPIPAIRSPGSTPKPPGGAPSATWTCCSPSPWSSGPVKSCTTGRWASRCAGSTAARRSWRWRWSCR